MVLGLRREKVSLQVAGRHDIVEKYFDSKNICKKSSNGGGLKYI